MATFLDLCQQVHRYARIDKSPPGTAPTTVLGQKGVLAEIVGWVQDAWKDIQRDQDDWRFRLAQGSVLLPQGTREVNPADQIGDYDMLRPYVANDCRKFILSAPQDTGPEAQQPVYLLDNEEWRGGIYERGGGAVATGRPIYATVTGDNSLRVYPTPGQTVRLSFDYQRQIQELETDGDSPSMPWRFHDVVVWRALMYYADTRDKTQESYQKWERRRKQGMQRLYNSQLPEITL